MICSCCSFVILLSLGRHRPRSKMSAPTSSTPPAMWALAFALPSPEAVMKPFLAASSECFRQGADGLVVDATLLYEAWPFDMTKVQRPVHFWQGSADTLVPEAINKTVADRTPGAIWHPVSGAGHFIALSHANEMLALAAKDFA